MGFFDLNIPYFESDKPLTDNPTRKSTRLKLIVKSMELGYTGIAYNRSIKGLMSESDRCSISLFPLSSLLKLSLSLSSAVNFHRNLLGILNSTPFRQYTRLTVLVDSSSQVSALNSGNPILKTYDIVAVRPLNQNAFEQACRASEVDMIAIDFSEKLPFRLKQPLVKAAIERGVYFEISYSSLIIDAQTRRQMISNAKLLVDWTRGRNLIFSSAAPSVAELRGPYDVANLLTLLGISMERAKAAISKNCRSLIANALRKKKFYKEVIRVELVSSSEQCHSKESGFDDWLKWDPISSGDGDLVLDEMAKSFNESSKAFKKVKAVDFASIVDGLPAHGLHIKDLVSFPKQLTESLDNRNLSCQQTVIADYGASEKAERLDLLLDEYQTPLNDASATNLTSGNAYSRVFPSDSQKCFSSSEEFASPATLTKKETKFSDVLETFSADHESELDGLQPQGTVNIYGTNVMPQADILKGYTKAEEFGTQANKSVEDPKCASRMDVCLMKHEAEVHDFQSERHLLICETHVMSSDDTAVVDTMRTDAEISLPNEECNRSRSMNVGLAKPDDVMDEMSAETDVKSNAVIAEETFTVLKDYSAASPVEECTRSYDSSTVLATQAVMDGISTQTDVKSTLKSSFASSVLSLQEGFAKSEQYTENGCGSADGFSVLGSNKVLVNNTDSSLASHEPMADVEMEEQKRTGNQFGMKYSVLGKSQSGRVGLKRRKSHCARVFPFKRLLNPVPFKKKARVSKCRSKTR